jgi:hypothetical protein
MTRRFYTSRKRAYRAHRDALGERFPAATNFLRGLELLCDGDHGFHMGTSQHVQFYFSDWFLFHLAIRDSATDAPWLELSPRHHGRLKEGTQDGAHLLFRQRIHRVVETLRVPAAEVMRRDDAYRIAIGTPLAFFRLLQGELFDIAAQSDDQPWQQELFAGAKRRKKKRRRKKKPTATLLAQARDAEEDVAALVRALEAEVGASLTLRIDGHGACIGMPAKQSTLQAESLVQAVAALLEASDKAPEVNEAADTPHEQPSSASAGAHE